MTSVFRIFVLIFRGLQKGRKATSQRKDKKAQIEN